MRIFKATAAALMVSMGAATGAAAQDQGFDPRANCLEVLQNATQAEQLMIAAWSFGYIAANTQNVRPVDMSNNAVILKNIAKVCQANPQASLIALVNASSSQPAQPATAPVEPGSKADAERVLRAFVAPGANHRALTQAILPTQAEVMQVYAEPLGSAIWAAYAQQMGPNVAFEPKPGQTELLIVHATTRALAERQPVLQEFPGGYAEVLPYFKVDVPIVRFKFVKPGETIGLAFDGLMYLNDRWVIMPKPWRAL